MEMKTDELCATPAFRDSNYAFAGSMSNGNTLQSARIIFEILLLAHRVVDVLKTNARCTRAYCRRDNRNSFERVDKATAGIRERRRDEGIRQHDRDGKRDRREGEISNRQRSSRLVFS